MKFAIIGNDGTIILTKSKTDLRNNPEKHYRVSRYNPDYAARQTTCDPFFSLKFARWIIKNRTKLVDILITTKKTVYHIKYYA